MTVVGLAPAGVLAGFGAFLIASGLFYGIPVPVQPMKAVSAVMLTGNLGAGEVAAAGLVLGALLLALGATGAIGRIARLIPPSVTTGLQLGLGLSMAALGLGLAAATPWLGLLVLAAVALLMRVPRCPAAPAALTPPASSRRPAGSRSAGAGRRSSSPPPGARSCGRSSWRSCPRSR